ncbi:UDP-4-amino-4-deoxy-L-arabinose--oxoglutarate aminotransferase [Achromobacter spanius]|uniref:DegT/DnrJ/EryC1/StrS family aminotransferase n=1 Tax=Achromobacter spanius TaxID=217203 RepID=UPI000C2B588A|nr:DegT/DnrJ/EryC1/StrS family aminotransferase [Achromobacter spanius]AUA55827.1 aminotransferase DegT [Achromobacter spanius]CAB3638854.1 UDP-2-acetamido-2-deoxy-3-oxo-D-glucuronate aminotransferase [Achromobacter spanius]SPT36710.1 UDP-4-amino-4-deoxy-L-arabinose--oxoglutarate aminotransferase [Achromobacter denitrificans]VEE56658.1 UDP-4-amino-4-deoxy-L-arabinose--oxoglutarate aminotransferase [Achromobacter spanius]
MQFIDLKKQYQVLRDPINARIQQVLDHGQYIMGPEVKELEAALQAYTDTKHCITVASGTEALLMSLMALGIGAGDEVITTSFTFVATAEVIVLLGATPVFVDVEPDTCNIKVADIEARISSRTKAIIPVSLYGQCGDMDEVNAIAARHGIAVIEDAAQSFGATYKGRKSGNLSTIGCTSFFPSKPLGCYGDGGAIFTNDDALAQACREIRVHGQSARYYHTRVGVGGRMDTLQCAVVLAKLERFGWEVEQRIRIGARYQALFADVANVRTVTVRPDRDSVWAQFTIMVQDRDGIIAALKAADIPTAIHYPRPIHTQPAYSRYADGSTPVSEMLASQVLSLPMHPDLDAETQNHIVQTVMQAAR